jgi:hypothetical protein
MMPSMNSEEIEIGAPNADGCDSAAAVDDAAEEDDEVWSETGAFDEEEVGATVAATAPNTVIDRN